MAGLSRSYSCSHLSRARLSTLTPRSSPIQHSSLTIAMANSKSFSKKSSATSASEDRRPTSSSLLTSQFSTPHSKSTPQSRLSIISRHLQTPHLLEVNTPYSTERRAASEQNSSSAIFAENSQNITNQEPSSTMSKQEPHPTVLIPGPIEYDDEVLKSMSHYSQAHVGPPFVKCFSEVLPMLRQLLQTENPKSQPFVISGSGTLGWDQVAANLAERGDEALVLHSGYFGDSFADCFETYGVKATQIKAKIGDRPQLPAIKEALEQKKYKIITVTHVDTSTGVLSEIEHLTKMVRQVSPETLVVVDGVCSVGCEEIRFDDMDLDVVMTASQKAIGCPAGLSILMASERAMKVFENRKTPPASYFASWKNWLPIMQNYEANKPSYFATPSPQLVHALHTSLKQILAIPLADRFKRHKENSDKVKAHVTSLGLKQLATDPTNQAAGMTAMWLPEGITAAEFLPGVLERGIVFAGGLHKEIATKYIRFGHMGVSVMDPNRGDITKALKALEERLAEVGYQKPN